MSQYCECERDKLNEPTERVNEQIRINLFSEQIKNSLMYYRFHVLQK